MQTFPPYSLGFKANIPALLAEVAKQVKPVEDDQPWINPFDTFNEASEAIVHHYREVADKVTFGGVLLEKWVVSSLITAAEVHIHLLDNPPTGGERFLDTVDDRLQWFLHAPAFFFREQPISLITTRERHVTTLLSWEWRCSSEGGGLNQPRRVVKPFARLLTAAPRLEIRQATPDPMALLIAS
jgi:hypothetical protein